MKRFKPILPLMLIALSLLTGCNVEQELCPGKPSERRNVTLTLSLGATSIQPQSRAVTTGTDLGTDAERTLQKVQVFFYPVTGSTVADNATPVFVHTKDYGSTPRIMLANATDQETLSMNFTQPLAPYKVCVLVNEDLTTPEATTYATLKAISKTSTQIRAGLLPFTAETDCDLTTNTAIQIELKRSVVRLDVQLKPLPGSNIQSLSVTEMTLHQEANIASLFAVTPPTSLQREDYLIPAADRTKVTATPAAVGDPWANAAIYTSPIEGTTIQSGAAYYSMTIQFTFSSGQTATQTFPRILINEGKMLERNNIYRLLLTAYGSKEIKIQTTVLSWDNILNSETTLVQATGTFNAATKLFTVNVSQGVPPYVYSWYNDDVLLGITPTTTEASASYTVANDITVGKLKCIITDANGNTLSLSLPTIK